MASAHVALQNCSARGGAATQILLQHLNLRIFIGMAVASPALRTFTRTSTVSRVVCWLANVLVAPRVRIVKATARSHLLHHLAQNFIGMGNALRALRSCTRTSIVCRVEILSVSELVVLVVSTVKENVGNLRHRQHRSRRCTGMMFVRHVQPICTFTAPKGANWWGNVAADL